MAKNFIYIKDSAKFLDRQVGTLRKWDREKTLPDELRPQRDDRDRRYWTQDQLDSIKKWLKETDRRPGKGLKHYHPTPEQVAQHLAHQRGPRLEE